MPAGFLGARPRQAAQLQRNTTTIRPEATVESRLTGLLRRDNPYMRQAEAQGNRQANARGLLSSSMAVGAVEDARVRAALPIAQQDAGLYGQAALQDSAYRQQGGLATQNYQNSASRADQDFGNQRSLIGVQTDANSRLQREGHGYTLAQQNNQGRIQGGLIDRQGNVNSRLQREGHGYTLAQQDNQGRIQGGLIDRQGGVDLRRDQAQFGYNTQLQGQQIAGQRTLAGDNFGYSTQLQAQQGDINYGLQGQQIAGQHSLSAQNATQQSALNREQYAAEREAAVRDQLTSLSTNTHAQIQAMQSNPDFSNEARAQGIRNLERMHNASATVISRGTELAGTQFVFGSSAGSAMGAPSQDSTRQPTAPPGEGYRWQYDSSRGQWMKTPIVSAGEGFRWHFDEQRDRWIRAPL